MAMRYARRFGLVAAAASLATVLTSAALGGPTGATAVNAHADFNSAVAPPSADCPSLGGTQVLVLGRGEATGGPFGKFDRAIGTAAECSQGKFPPEPVPQLDGCHNVSPGSPFFDVHGKGFYMTKDGSVLYLVYHEVSENPFIFGSPPFELHDCGVWQVDGAHSTGTFAGATGSGTITADVPVRADFSAHVSADYVGTITLAAGAKGPGGRGDVNCTGTMSDAPITGNLTVQSGQSCDLEHSAVNGNVSVEPGGSLFIHHSVVDGNLACNGCAATNSIYSTVFGNFDVDGSLSGSAIVGTVVTGNLEVGNSSAGAGAFALESNYEVGGNLLFHDNTGFSTIAGNTVEGSLNCQNNTPAPVLQDPANFLFGNDANAYKGQCTQ